MSELFGKEVEQGTVALRGRGGKNRDGLPAAAPPAAAVPLYGQRAHGQGGRTARDADVLSG